MKVDLTLMGCIGRKSKLHSSSILDASTAERLSIKLLDDELVTRARKMATVYTAIAAFENSVRAFIIKKSWKKSVKPGGTLRYPRRLGQRPNLVVKRKIRLGGMLNGETHSSIILSLGT